MRRIGGRAVVAHAFTIAEDAEAPLDRRRLALGVLERAVPRDDAASADRLARDVASLPVPVGGVVPTDLVVYLRRAVQTCYARALKQDPAARGALALTLRFAKDGSTVSVVEGDVSSDLQRCMVTAANRFHPTAGVELPATLRVPFTLVPQ
jgi:hypothetical protein